MARNDSDDDLLGLGITIKTNVQIQAELVAEKDRYFKPLIQRIDSEIEYLERQRDCAESSYNYANKSAEGLLQKAITRINNIHVRAYKAATENIQTGLSTQEGSSLEDLLAIKPKNTLSIEDDAEVSIGYIPEELAELLLPESAKEEDVIARAELIASQYANNFGGEANARRVISDPLTNQFRLCALKRIAGEEYGSYISEIDKLLKELIQKRDEVTDKDANTAERIQKNESPEQLKSDIQIYSNETTTFLRSIASERNALLARMQDVAENPAYQIDERKFDSLPKKLRNLVIEKVKNELPDILGYSKLSLLEQIQAPNQKGSYHPNSPTLHIEELQDGKSTIYVIVCGGKIDITTTETSGVFISDKFFNGQVGIKYIPSIYLGTILDLGIKHHFTFPPPTEEYEFLFITDLNGSQSSHATNTTIFKILSSSPDILSPIKMSDIFPELHLNEKDKKRGRRGVKIPEEFRHFISLPAEIEKAIELYIQQEIEREERKQQLKIEEALGTNHQTEVRLRNAEKRLEPHEGNDLDPKRASVLSRFRNLFRRGGKEE